MRVFCSFFCQLTGFFARNVTAAPIIVGRVKILAVSGSCRALNLKEKYDLDRAVFPSYSCLALSFLFCWLLCSESPPSTRNNREEKENSDRRK